MVKLLDAVVAVACLPLAIAAPSRPYNSLLISRVVEGKGLSKAIEILNPEGNVAVPYDAMYMTIVWNGNTERTVRLQRPRGASSNSFHPGERMALCTFDAVRDDDDNSMCLGDMSLVGSKFEYSVLRFNGNDQLTLDLRLDRGKKPTQVQDVFGDRSGDYYTVCDRPRAAKNSVLTRKSWIGRGDPFGSFETFCQWDWSPLAPTGFTLPPATWSGAIDRSSLNIRDNRINIEVKPGDIYVKTANSKRVRVADMEVNTQRSTPSSYNAYTQVCIKQDSYLPELLRECSFFWDVGVPGFDAQGIPIPFDYTVSGTFDADPKSQLVIFVGSIAISGESCNRYEANPLEQFGEYTSSYLCETDADCAPLSGIIGAPAVCKTSSWSPNFCAAQGGSEFGSRKGCDFDIQCSSNEFCSLNGGDCRSKDMLMKVRAQQDNVVIPAGATKSIVFRVDELQFNTVAIGTVLNLVTTGNPANLELKYGIHPQNDDIEAGSIVDYSGTVAQACNQIASTEVGEFYVSTYEVLTLSDSDIVGDWEFTITNNNNAPVSALGAFWALDVQGD